MGKQDWVNIPGIRDALVFVFICGLAAAFLGGGLLFSQADTDPAGVMLEESLALPGRFTESKLCSQTTLRPLFNHEQQSNSPSPALNPPDFYKRQ